MAERKFSIKRFLLTLIAVYILSYLAAFFIMGVVWDPNGVNLSGRPFIGIMTILGGGFMLALPMGASSFIVDHPVPLTMGVGFLSCLILGFIGIKEVTGRRLIYLLLAFLTILGTVQFCLMA